MIQIGNRIIGDGQPCFITFEAGPTHAGVESAKRLIRHAAEAGADAIKFQIFDPFKLVADPDLPFTYEVLADRETGRQEAVTEPLRDILERRMLCDDEWRELKAYADECGLAFFATGCFEEDIDLLVSMGAQSIKIASADVDHFPLLRYAARTGLCIQIDTGSSSMGEVEAAVDVIRAEGNNNIIIHQCPSGYPARLESINLKVIPSLKTLFQVPVAFSDHTPGWEMDVAAVALGANLVEKTITEDRMTRSVEHVMSIEPSEMKAFVQTIREVEIGLGQARRAMSAEERHKRMAVRRGIYLKHALPAGHVLSDADIEFRRPGFGIRPAELDRVLGAVLRAECAAGHALVWNDLDGNDLDGNDSEARS